MFYQEKKYYNEESYAGMEENNSYLLGTFYNIKEALIVLSAIITLSWDEFSVPTL